LDITHHKRLVAKRWKETIVKWQGLFFDILKAKTKTTQVRAFFPVWCVHDALDGVLALPLLGAA
jgi:hypothetical protein